MIRGISAFTDLPTPVKAGAVVVSGGGLLAGLRYLLSPGVFWVVLIGLSVLALVVVLYLRLLKWLKKRKAAPMERDLLQSSSVTPQGVSEPASVARLDDLRKKFAEGTRRFQQAGKSLYDFPWYMIVGEPGSGKTEAIRHCNVGFPPGLQDELQGTGGTINMNWWFTDHAVMLDTAGRLMFDEVDTGGSQEWKEFLSLMKKYRPRCPVNGLLLVIPADSLIRDSADQIEQKASKIARQLDMIQRTLDVRFPVFVAVTKSDLITGFRDFFDSLQDPKLQHQMLGWSNPAPLDEPYNSGFVDQQIAAVRGRLFRRRLALLNEVLAEEPDAEKRRTADALYAFPQSLARLAPRMTRYLELIFSVGSKWSCKPLFFRGIYFTSSMREGSALDADLAESLGVPVESLPDGRVWERDRAYFLRDVFVKKIFPEKGLVTPATNAARLHKRRKAAVYISLAASLLLLLFFILYGARQFDKSIGHLRDYFPPLAALMAEDPLGTAEDLQTIKVRGSGCIYLGRSFMKDIEDTTRANVSARLAQAVSEFNEKGVPWIFAPAAKFRRRITEAKLNEAQAVIYETAVLEPFVKATRGLLLAQGNGAWTRQDPQVKALRQLIRLEAGKPLGDEDGYSAETFLDVLSAYIFKYDENEEGSEKATLYSEDKGDLHEPLKSLYHPAGAATWPPASLRSDPCTPEAALQQGISHFNEYWRDPTSSPDYAKAKTIRELEGALQDFNDAEQRIFALQDRLPGEPGGVHTVAQLDAFARAWNDEFARLKAAKDAVDGYRQRFAADATLEQLWTQAAEPVLQDVNENYDFLLSELKDVNAPHFLISMRDQLSTTRRTIIEKLRADEHAQERRQLDRDFWANGQGNDRLYDIRFEIYSRADSCLRAADSAPALAQVGQMIAEFERVIDTARKDVRNLFSLHQKAFHFPEAVLISTLGITAAEQKHLHRTAQSAFAAAPKSVEEIEKLVEANAAWDWKGIPAELVDKKYDPQAAAAVMAGWKSLGEILGKYELPNERELRRTHEDAKGKYTEYASRCIGEYWLDRVLRGAIQAQVARDAEQFNTLVVRNVFDELEELGKAVERALLEFGTDGVPEDKTRAQFAADLEKLMETDQADKTYRHCRGVLSKWRSLSDDVWEARRALLGVQPADFREDYIPFSYRSYAMFVDAYWTELTYTLLRQRAQAVHQEGTKAFRELQRGYGNAFPLAWDSRTDLPPDQLVQAGLLLSKSRSQEKFDAQTIGGEATTDIDAVNELLAQLRGIQLAGNDAGWFERVERLFESLPRGQEPYYCKMTLLGAKEQMTLARPKKEQLVLDFVRKFRLVQGTRKSGQLGTSAPEDAPVDSLIVEYPGPPLAVEFYRYIGDSQPIKNATLTFAEPWACLRMLRDCHDGQKEGCVKLVVPRTEEQDGGVLYFRLDFFRDHECKQPVNMLTSDQWPSLKQ
ncbi:MAG: hypothetical protein JW741_29970 [Sedimentisphaerales bacterium]|nr:hypothetical protein [Sedimentisphaerales bacterium]